MENIFGIVAEYNPFHSGHGYQLTQARLQGASHIVVAMSGTMVQRGELACFSKWTRAKAAIECGADLVIELPVLFSCASAERFAAGGVSLLSAIGCDTLFFGSERKDTQAILRCAQACLQVQRAGEIEPFLKMGLSYPAARRAAVCKAYGEDTARLLDTPNSTLAVEYCKAIYLQNSKMIPLALKRYGAGHDSEPDASFQIEREIPSASGRALRRMLDEQGLFALEGAVPQKALAVFQEEKEKGWGPVFSHQTEILLFQKLREASMEDFARLPDVSEGLENRLFRAARQAECLDTFFSLSKTKRYPMARLRRIIWYLFFGISSELFRSYPLPRYGRVLAANEKGLSLLARARGRSDVLFSPDFPALAKQFPHETAMDCRATDLFTLLQPQPQRSGMDFLKKPWLQKSSNN